MQDRLKRLADRLDIVNEAMGRLAAWGTLFCVLTCFGVVLARHLLGFSPIWAQELYVWLHAAVFMAGAGYTLKHGGHVRVDALSGRFGPRARAVIDIIGTLALLFPWLGLLAWHGFDFVADSWRRGEVSGQPGGLGAIWLLKSLILVFCAGLFIQALALLARAAVVLAGGPDGSQHDAQRVW